MTADFSDMMYLFSCGAHGLMPSMPRTMNIDNIYRLAVSQGVWPTVFLAMKKLWDNGRVFIDDEEYSAIKGQVLLCVLQNIKRRSAVHDVMNMLEDNGIACCVLKGEAIARLYCEPAFRISGDTDILIDSALEDQAVQLLREYGLEVHTRNTSSHHFRCYGAATGFIEFHVALYSESSNTLYFNHGHSFQEYYVEVVVDDNKTIKTLGITDGIIYLTLHAIKHFLHKGVGIRQLMDMALYMKRYQAEIHWDKFNCIMKKLKFNTFIDYSVTICVKHLGFAYQDFAGLRNYEEYLCDENILNRLIDDIRKGGVFGFDDQGRRNFKTKYLSRKYYSQKRIFFGVYGIWKRMWTSASVLFPSLEHMCRKFNYLRRFPLLLPIAWVHRMVVFLLERQSTDVVEDTSKERLELLRQLNML